MHGTLELHLKYFARICRELSELHKLFGELKQRPRTSTRKNEANEEEAQQRSNVATDDLSMWASAFRKSTRRVPGSTFERAKR